MYICVAGTVDSVLIKGGVLISTHLYVAGTVDNILIKGGVLISCTHL